MPSHKMRIHPGAQLDVDSAYQWYLKQSETAARRFLDEIDAAKQRIVALPEWWGGYVEGTRRISLRRYPYSIIFRVIDDTVVIIAVAHAKRDEAFWTDR